MTENDLQSAQIKKRVPYLPAELKYATLTNKVYWSP